MADGGGGLQVRVVELVADVPTEGAELTPLLPNAGAVRTCLCLMCARGRGSHTLAVLKHRVEELKTSGPVNFSNLSQGGGGLLLRI